MDRFIIVIDLLVILFYLLLIALLSPYLMRFLMKRNHDVFFQLIPVLSLIVISSITISMGYGGFSETLFFRLTSILSIILLLCLLFLTLIMKKVWPENYEKLITKLAIPKRKQLSS
ncbi:hypothetical protein [Sporosarcina sp. YIM B06819]|uniref:hypothetical protein n=1 Tax=Sporosarcina sp. YIM B06819 TaxID=3081769 RepID=UPI00298D49FD|nr:hypothetical protein [Sporosarcina sp. YIM B06819]